MTYKRFVTENGENIVGQHHKNSPQTPHAHHLSKRSSIKELHKKISAHQKNLKSNTRSLKNSRPENLAAQHPLSPLQSQKQLQPSHIQSQTKVVETRSTEELKIESKLRSKIVKPPLPNPINYGNYTYSSPAQSAKFKSNTTFASLWLLVGVSAIFIFILATVSYAFIKLSNDCWGVHQVIAGEMGLDQNYCRVGLNDINLRNFNDPRKLIQPKLAQIEILNTEYQIRQNAYNTNKSNYQQSVIIAKNLGITSSKSVQDPQFTFVGKDSLKKNATNLDVENRKVRSQIDEFVKEVAESHIQLDRTIAQAKKLSIDTKAAQALSKKISNQTAQTPAKALQLKQSFTSLRQIQSELQNKISNYRAQLPSQFVQIPILMYHRVENFDNLSASEKSNVRKDLTISPQNFAKQLDFIQSKGFITVTMQEMYEAMSSQNKAFFDGKKIMLTFDDGYKEHYTIVYPELKKRKMKGVFGVYAKYQAISGAQLKEMADNKMEIVSHSYSHCMLGSYSASVTTPNPENGSYRPCSNLSYGFRGQKMIPLSEAEYELKESRLYLEKIIQKPVRHYIHPYGSYNQATLDLLQKTGYDMALAVGGGPTVDINKPYTVNRVTISGLNQVLGGWFATL